MQVELSPPECKLLWLLADLGLDAGVALDRLDLQLAIRAIQKVYRAQLGKGA